MFILFFSFFNCLFMFSDENFNEINFDTYNYINTLKDKNYNQIEFKIDEINNKLLQSIDKNNYMLGIMFLTDMYKNAKFLLSKKKLVLSSIFNRVKFEIDNYQNTDFDLLSASTIAYSLIGNDSSIIHLYELAIDNSKKLTDPSRFDQYLENTYKNPNYDNTKFHYDFFQGSYAINNNIISNQNEDNSFNYNKGYKDKKNIPENDNLKSIKQQDEIFYANPYDIFVYKTLLNIQFAINSIGNILTKKSSNYLYKLAVNFYDIDKDLFKLCLSYLLANYRYSFEEIRDLESKGYIPYYTYQNVIDKTQSNLEKEIYIPVLFELTTFYVSFAASPLFFKHLFMTYIRRSSFFLRVLSFRIFKRKLIDIATAIKLFKPKSVLLFKTRTFNMANKTITKKIYVHGEIQKIVGNKVYIKNSKQVLTLGEDFALKFDNGFNKYLKMGDEIIIRKQLTDGSFKYKKVKIAGVTNGEIVTKCPKSGGAGKTYPLEGLDYYFIKSTKTTVHHRVPYFKPKTKINGVGPNFLDF